MPPAPYVLIFDPTAPSGQWLHKQLSQIHIPARWVSTLAELLVAAEEQSPVVCLFALRPPISQALEHLANLIQEPRFAHTAFIGVGSLHDKHAAFEAGADDYLITPPDIIELRKRVRLHLDRAALEARLVAETRITQEMEALSEQTNAQAATAAQEAVSLLEHVARLTRERDLYETTLRSAGCPIALVAPEGTSDYVNPAWEQYFGPAEALPEVLGWPPHTDSPEVDSALQQVIAAVGAWQGSARLRTVSGHWVEMMMVLTPIMGAAGELYAYVLVMMDISARQLPYTRRANLIADAITELRSPLSNIKTRLYLLESTPTELQADHLRTLNEEVAHLVQVLEKISELFHLDEGLTTATRKPIELNQLVQGVAARYSAQAAQPFTFRFIPYENLPTVTGDIVQLARALGVLLECIMHVSPPKTRVTLEVGLSFAADHPFATVQVRNAELPALAEQAFSTQAQEVFYVGAPNTAELQLNLAIAREIVRLHNGMLTIAQGKAHQYALTLWLPLSASEAGGAAEAFQTPP